MNEALIIHELRNLKPFERLEIVADRAGKVDNYLLHKSSKVVLTDETVLRVK